MVQWDLNKSKFYFKLYRQEVEVHSPCCNKLCVEPRYMRLWSAPGRCLSLPSGIEHVRHVCLSKEISIIPPYLCFEISTCGTCPTTTLSKILHSKHQKTPCDKSEFLFLRRQTIRTYPKFSIIDKWMLSTCMCS